MLDYSGIVILVLAFVDGLLFGLAVKKGVVSFVLLLVAIVISAYAGFSFVPNISLGNLWNNTILPYITNHLTSVSSLIPIGGIGSLSLVIVLFIIGLGIGIWKG